VVPLAALVRMSGRGRPSIYTDDIAEEICERLANGESLLAICQDDHLPQEPTVRNWALDDKEGFFAKYERARILQAHNMFDETLVIADDKQADVVIDDKGIRTVNGEVVQRSRLRVDTRKWYLSKVLPKIYGDKHHMELSAPGGGPIAIAVTRRVVDVSGS